MEDKIKRLIELKQRRKAIIMAHFYQPDEIQQVADFLGDSLALAQAARATTADTILFCGVKFMAETAKILNPGKTVLLPDLKAGCTLADAASPAAFKRWKEDHPGHVFVTYINCSTEVKAMSDIICTSSNAVKIIESLPADAKICFAPDKNLGAYLEKKTGRKMTLWNGSCLVHRSFSEQSLIEMQQKHPFALVLAHPECPENLLAYADFIGSTNAILNFAKQCEQTEFIILTEPGIFFRLKKDSPQKKFYQVETANAGNSCNICPFMKLNTIDKMISALETDSPAISMDENLRLAALKPLDKMLEISL